ncbi:PREDICTED: heme-binding-like protein At3g10130, chloroplastic isoform X1 [Theobroma cacao]|uniref:Heme-binding-like protein At3g10130, chloroplastic isoform X1 n=1 Tax=Theobroma cacao TaxID=3641 RepID=A0AB32WE56_THECC|nr:PREDICTED: heme-binding-like protein At3g10130, chloroplastic isoform X1 [Theobroma cacao]XP_017976125.1 PREDICTED: heme-binding-like protein At3g10130, chloroplastic isoform X1 [Theobroma cacao]
MLLFKPSMAAQSLPKTLIFSSTQSPNAHRASLDIAKSMVTTERTATTTNLAPPQRRTVSASEARISLVFALASQASSVSQRRKFLMDLASETAKYVFPKRFESRNLEEALMAVPDLETVRFKVLSRTDQYEIRVVEPYFIAETTMPGKTGFDFNGASQSFNVLAEYLFGKNTSKETMEMTTPVFTSRTQSDGERMEMTTPVITKKVEKQGKWQMSFVMPSKYGSNVPLPKDPSVRIKEVPRKVVAVVAFSGFVTDEEVKRRELKLRDALKNDRQFQVKEGASVEVAQYNPPFTLPFTRRNEIALEVEKKEG